MYGFLRPIIPPAVEEASLDREVPTFRILQDVSDSERMRFVTSAAELLASLCVEAGKLDYLRKSVYLILRYCNMDSGWLLSVISSFARVCGRQLFSAGSSDISGQAVAVVISELLNDAEGPGAVGKENVLPGNPSGRLDDASEEREEKCLEVRNNRVAEETPGVFSTRLEHLRSCVGRFEDNLNFENLLPRIFQALFSVISPDVRETLSNTEAPSSGPPCEGRRNHIVEDQTAESAVAAVVGKVDGASSQICKKIKLEDMDRYCWQCSYSRNKFLGVWTRDVLNRSESTVEGELKFHEITHALEVVSFHLGWDWTYNDLLVQHLSKRVYPGAPDMTVSFVAKSLGILGRLGIEADGTELPGVQEVRGILLAILESGVRVSGRDGGVGGFSFPAQVAAAESLLNLCRGVRKYEENNLAGFNAIRVSILAWFQALDPASGDSLPPSLSRGIASL